MRLSAFEKTNLKSRKVRSFFILLLYLVVVYIIGFVIYYVIGTSDMAGQMFNDSLIFLVISILLIVFLWLLRWQILRTGILALTLLSLAHLFCAIFLLMNLSPIAHAVGLIGISILFLAAFIGQSNLRIYLLDRTYMDAFIEFLVAFGFILFIGRMLITTLSGN